MSGLKVRMMVTRLLELVAKILMVLGLSLVVPSLSLATGVDAKIERIADATHIEFSGSSQWDYDLQQIDKNKVRLLVPAVNLKSLTNLSTWNDELIKSIDVRKSGPDNKYEILIELADGAVESFDYLTDQPSRLIIDFFRSEKPASSNVVSTETPTPSGRTPAAQVAKAKQPMGEVKSSVTRKGDYKKRDRRPASEIDAIVQSKISPGNKAYPQVGVYDAGDPNYDRFRLKDYEIKEESIIASRDNIYIRFPALQLQTNILTDLMSETPEYTISPKDTKENKEARLLQVLFNNQRYNVFLTTYPTFLKTYPDTVYEEIIHHMAAEIHFKMWQRDNARVHLSQTRKIYEELIEKYPDSPLNERVRLIVAFIDFELGNPIEIVRQFKKFIEDFPQSHFLDNARFAQTDGLLRLKKYDQAIVQLEEIATHPKDKKAASEATYRIGDVYFALKNYKKAIAAYKAAIESYPEQRNTYPNALYNMAEGYFWEGAYKDSLDNYINYIQAFPSHSHTSYAMTRIGEVLDILGADRTKAIGAFLESYFRFKNTPGADIARIRLLSQRMEVMKEKELKNVEKEFAQIRKNSVLPEIDEFVSLMLSDGLHRRKDYDRSLNLLVEYYQTHPTSTNLSFFLKRILRNIADSIRQDLNKEDFLAALKTHSKHSKTWLRTSDRIDIPYSIARSYELAGVYVQAGDGYKETLERLQKIQDSQEYKERKVYENLPSIPSIQLRLAKINFEQRRYQEALKYLDAIRTGKGLSEPEEVERVGLIASLAEERGQYQIAKKNLEKLIENWEGKQENLIPGLLRLAKAQYRLKEYSPAEASIARIEILKSEGASLSEDLWPDTLELKARTLEMQGKEVAAVEAYMQLLDGYEKTRPLSHIRYRVGELLFQMGDLNGADKIWSRLPDESRLYKQLAQEKLQNAEWQDEYKKYIDRIPAMSDVR